ncbi:MAG: glycosyltransferase [Sphingomonadales bacterium]|nr:glycosyltransferase [Sphingomonadales bacterium]MDE2171612.1 glycosyltransferase [Sphingomonadales bacterium]
MTKPPSPAISVALSVYDGERFLAAAIESILGQSFSNFEFLILDDGSRDASRAIIEHYAARDSRIRPILRENRGLIASLNQLLHEARAPLIARMDADDISLPHRFARQHAFLAEHPDYAVIGCWTEDIDDQDQPWPIDAPPHPVTHEAFLERIRSGGPLMCHPAVMMRRDVALSVGGYHAAYRHCEDLDLWLRLSSRARLGSLPEKLIRYRHYADQVSSRHATQQQIGAAIALLAWREREAGRPDPTEHLAALPPVDQLDSLFGREGTAREVRAKVAHGLLYSREGLRKGGLDLILRHIADGGARDGMWRTVLRLLRFGDPLRALRLATALATH